MSQKERSITAVPLWEKYALTIRESAQYFGIGEKTLRKLVEEHIDEGFVLQIGSKTLIKRVQFEVFLSKTSAI